MTPAGMACGGLILMKLKICAGALASVVVDGANFGCKRRLPYSAAALNGLGESLSTDQESLRLRYQIQTGWTIFRSQYLATIGAKGFPPSR